MAAGSYVFAKGPSLCLRDVSLRSIWFPHACTLLVSIDDLPVHRFAPCVLLFVRVCLSAVALVSSCFAFVWRLLIGPLVDGTHRR